VDVDEDKLKEAIKKAKAKDDPTKDDVDGEPYDPWWGETNNSNDWVNRRLEESGGKKMLDYRGGWL